MPPLPAAAQAVNVQEALASHGKRCTANRARVLKVFADHPDTPFTHDDVYRALLQAGTPIPIGSVCRTVVELGATGVLCNLREGGPRRRAIYQLAGGNVRFVAPLVVPPATAATGAPGAGQEPPGPRLEGFRGYWG